MTNTVLLHSKVGIWVDRSAESKRATRFLLDNYNDSTNIVLIGSVQFVLVICAINFDNMCNIHLSISLRSSD